LHEFLLVFRHTGAGVVRKQCGWASACGEGVGQGGCRFKVCGAGQKFAGRVRRLQVRVVRFRKFMRIGFKFYGCGAREGKT